MARVEIKERPSDRKNLAAWYSTALRRQEASGLSVAALAEELGVTTTTLYQWRRRLSGQRGGGGVRPGPTGLVEVTVDRSSAASVRDGFVVRLGGDRSIEVPGVFEDADLRRLVAVLESC